MHYGHDNTAVINRSCIGCDYYSRESKIFVRPKRLCFKTRLRLLQKDINTHTHTHTHTYTQSPNKLYTHDDDILSSNVMEKNRFKFATIRTHVCDNTSIPLYWSRDVIRINGFYGNT
jgi:hypothetical protein